MLGPLQGWVSMFPYAKVFPLLILATFLVDHHAALGKPLKHILGRGFGVGNDGNDLYNTCKSLKNEIKRL